MSFSDLTGPAETRAYINDALTVIATSHERRSTLLNITRRHSPLHSLIDDLRLMDDVAERYGQQRHADHQRPQAELKPAAFAFRRVGLGWLGLHGRIISGRKQREQEILDGGTRAGRGRCSAVPVFLDRLNRFDRHAPYFVCRSA